MDAYLTLDEVAAHYRRTVKAMRRLRDRGLGPRAVRVEGRVLFPREEVERYDRQIREQLRKELA